MVAPLVEMTADSMVSKRAEMMDDSTAVRRVGKMEILLVNLKEFLMAAGRARSMETLNERAKGVLRAVKFL